MRDELRVYTISDSHWTGISCSCCNGGRAKRGKTAMAAMIGNEERHDGAMTVSSLRRQIMDEVAEALSNAHENGHDFKGWTDEAIADDMYECGGIDVANEYPRDMVVAAIRDLRT